MKFAAGVIAGWTFVYGLGALWYWALNGMSGEVVAANYVTLLALAALAGFMSIEGN